MRGFIVGFYSGQAFALLKKNKDNGWFLISPSVIADLVAIALSLNAPAAERANNLFSTFIGFGIGCYLGHLSIDHPLSNVHKI